MKQKIVWLVVSCLMVLVLLVASCAKAETPATKGEAPATKGETPATKGEAPATKGEAPAVKEAAPATKGLKPAQLIQKKFGYKVSPGADASYDEKPKYGGTLIVGRSTNIINWDEAFATPWGLANSLGPTNEDIITGDWAKGMAGSGETDWFYDTGQVLPSLMAGQLVESWEFPDDQTIIFKVRKGVRWSLDPNNAASKLVGGRELTAEDIAFNIRRIFVDYKNATMYTSAGVARALDAVATDKYTVKVTTPPKIYGMTWDAFDETKVMAPEVAAKYGDYQKWENSVGTGGFILKDWVNMATATWVRNPNHWQTNPVGPGKGDQLPYLDGIKMVVIPDQATRQAALRTGKIDLDTGGYPAPDAQQFIPTAPKVLYKSFNGIENFISMRLDKPELPWAPQFDEKALKVRRALNLATDNKEILNVIHGGEGEVLSYKTPKVPVHEGIYTELDKLPQDIREQFEYHPDKAKQLLTEAGYPDGFKANILVASSTPAKIDEVQMLKAYWAKIGIELEIRVVDNAVFQQYYIRKTHDQMWTAGSCSNHSHTMMTVTPGACWNMSMVSDPKMDEHFFKIASVYFDEPKWKAAMSEMNLYVLSQVVQVYTGAPMAYHFFQPWLKNFDGSGGLGMMSVGAAWKFAWIDQELKKSMGY